jgi:hypothetical protein
MQLYFMRTVERRQHGQIDHAPRTSIKSRAAPNLSPAILSHKFLERTREIVCGRDGFLDMLSTKNFTADLQAFFK